MYKLVSNGNLEEGQNNLKEIKYFEPLFCNIIQSPNPTFLPSLREIDDLSCVVFLMGTPLIISPFIYDNFQTLVVS